MRTTAATLMVLASMPFALASEVSAKTAVPDLIVKESKLSVADTIDALAKAVEAKGIKVVARVDHAAGAKSVSKELPPNQVLIFGNPMLGTPLMAANPAIGIELPMKVHAYTGANGKVMVAYANPAALKARYRIKTADPQFTAMTEALAAFTTAATAPK